MFHTWVADQDQAESSNKRRTSTLRACEPCRKRKIRCNGGKPMPDEQLIPSADELENPCSNCVWYKRSPGCHYTEPRQRHIPSRRSIEQMRGNLQDYREVFQSLFPTVQSPDEVKGLDRESLLGLVTKTSPAAISSPQLHEASSVNEGVENSDALHLEHFQPLPEEQSDGTESRQSGLKGITDDINALSLSVKKPLSYLGISSVTATLRVILWLDPEAQAYFVRTPERSHCPSREPSYHSADGFMFEEETPRPEKTASAWDEIPLINAYFEYIHPIAPLLEEQSFRDAYMAQARYDNRWLLLLNTVLALGSVANSSHSDDHGHRFYWQRAKQSLNIDTLNSAHIETVQALSLLGGLYLHYISEPTLASSLMGATFRLAISLGLHRDYSEGIDPAKRAKNERSIEIRRRIWWSIFALDSWIGYGLGRPSMGRMNQAVSVKVPQKIISSKPQLLTLTQENVQFCLISTRMEDALAQSPIIPEAQRHALDEAFVQWFNSSSTLNNTPQAQQGESHGVSVAKNIMRWRYMLCRILLHRPILLWASMRKLNFAHLPQEKKASVEACREITFELVNDIAMTWRVSRPCSMAGWNATWLLYQALMVPLLYLFADRSDEGWNTKNQMMIETGIATFNDMRVWSQTAARSAEVISRIYQASRRHETAYYDSKPPPGNELNFGLPSQQPHATGPLDFTLTGSPTQEIYMNDVFDSLNWSNNWVDETFPYTQGALSFDQGQDDILGTAGSFDSFMPQSQLESGFPQLSGTAANQDPHTGYF